MSDWAPIIFICITAAGVSFVAGHGRGYGRAHSTWRNKIVDDPAYVEAVRAEVLATRARTKLEAE